MTDPTAPERRSPFRGRAIRVAARGRPPSGLGRPEPDMADWRARAAPVLHGDRPAAPVLAGEELRKAVGDLLEDWRRRRSGRGGVAAIGAGDEDEGEV